jgi:hypothetical protein
VGDVAVSHIRIYAEFFSSAEEIVSRVRIRHQRGDAACRLALMC